MKASKGQANPALVNEFLAKKLEGWRSAPLSDTTRGDPRIAAERSSTTLMPWPWAGYGWSLPPLAIPQIVQYLRS